MNIFSDGLNAEDFIGFSLPHTTKEIVFLEDVSSTNDYAKDLGKTNVSQLTVVAANQHKGKGRLGRSWDGGMGKDIYLSLILKNNLKLQQAQLLTLMAGVCAAKTIGDYLPNKNPLIKWPNDIVVEGKKLCGILAESAVDQNGQSFIVLGIGINVNRESFPQELREKATSLYIETGDYCHRAPIIKKLLNYIDKEYNLLMTCGSTALLKDYKDICVNLGKTVIITKDSVEYKAEAIDITDQGLLKVRKENGEILTIGSGEVSVRGIYGYV